METNMTLCALKPKLQCIKSCDFVYIQLLEATSNCKLSHGFVYKTWIFFTFLVWRQ